MRMKGGAPFAMYVQRGAGVALVQAGGWTLLSSLRLCASNGVTCRDWITLSTESDSGLPRCKRAGPGLKPAASVSPSPNTGAINSDQRLCSVLARASSTVNR